MDAQTYLTDRDLARRFAVARPTIWRWTHEGTFPAPVRLTPGCTRWKLSDVQQWEAQRAEQVPA